MGWLAHIARIMPISFTLSMFQPWTRSPRGIEGRQRDDRRFSSENAWRECTMHSSDIYGWESASSTENRRYGRGWVIDFYTGILFLTEFDFAQCADGCMFHHCYSFESMCHLTIWCRYFSNKTNLSAPMAERDSREEEGVAGVDERCDGEYGRGYGRYWFYVLLQSVELDIELVALRFRDPISFEYLMRFR